MVFMESLPDACAGSSSDCWSSENVVYLREFKDSSLASDFDIQAKVVSHEAESGTITLNVTSLAPAAFVSLETPIAGHFSDNNFLLLPWQPRTLTFQQKGGAEVVEELFLDLLEILSLADLGGQADLEDCPAAFGNCSDAPEHTASARSQIGEQMTQDLPLEITAS